MKTLAWTLTGLLAALAPSCATTPHSSAHGNQGVRVHGVIWGDADTQTSVGGGAQTSTDTDVLGLGVAYEQFVEPGLSWTAGIDRREYDPSGGTAADATELRFGLRGYLNPQEEFQPFVAVNGFYGLGLEQSGFPDSDAYIGIGVGGGVAWWASKDVSLEASLQYETTLSHPDTTVGGVTTENQIDGLSAQIGFGLWF